jgi:hypothetical protein
MGDGVSYNADYGGFTVGMHITFSFCGSEYPGVVVAFDAPDWIGVEFTTSHRPESAHNLAGLLSGDVGFWCYAHQLKPCHEKGSLDEILFGENSYVRK